MEVAVLNALWGKMLGIFPSKTQVTTALSEKQATLISGMNIKTINSKSVLGSGDMSVGYTPTLQSTPTSSTTTYTKDGNTVDFEIGQFARVVNPNSPLGYTFYQLYDLVTSGNTKTAVWVSDNLDPIPQQENVIMSFVKYTDLTSSQPAVGVGVLVTVDGVSTSYVSDQTGSLAFFVPLGQTYTVDIIPPTDYYVFGGKSSYTMVSDSATRRFTVRLMPYQTGLYIVDESGAEWLLDDWKTEVEAERKSNSQAKLIKVATAQLCEENGVFGVSIDGLRERSYVSTDWGGRGTLIDPPGIESYAYNGLLCCSIILETAAEIGINLPAVSLAYSNVFHLQNIDLQGFLGAREQWRILMGLATEVDEILEYTRPNGTYLLSTFTNDKWTCTQRTADEAYIVTTVITTNYNTKYYSRFVVPFYAL